MNLNELQQKVDEFVRDKNLVSSVDVRVLDLVSEVGELSKEVLKGTEYGGRKFQITENWESELGDVIFSLICIANSTGTNLVECLTGVLEKYQKRLGQKGDIGSGK